MRHPFFHIDNEVMAELRAGVMVIAMWPFMALVRLVLDSIAFWSSKPSSWLESNHWISAWKLPTIHAQIWIGLAVKHGLIFGFVRAQHPTDVARAWST